MHKKYGFPHGEKLKSVVRIDTLFNKGKSFWVFPCSVYYRIAEAGEIPAPQILMSVGKRYFRHAVDRNRMKRLLREAYRLNKQSLMKAVEETGLNFNVGLVFKSRNLLDFASVENSMKTILQQLESIIRKKAVKA